jgi:glycosyltransferase involved in cell wall biosynthesis
VEAQAAGLPVIAGNNSSQPEVAGDGAILVNAANSNEIGDAVVKIFTDIHLRADLISKGKLNCQKFTWDKTAQKTAEFLQEFFLKEKTPEKIMNGI